MLGYDKVGYKVLLNGKLIVARNVKVIENEKNLIGFAGFDFDMDTDDESSKASRDSDSDSEVFENSVEEPSRRNENVNTINENVGTKGSKEKMLAVKKFCVDLAESEREPNFIARV